MVMFLWAQDPNLATQNWIFDEERSFLAPLSFLRSFEANIHSRYLGNINKGYRPACVVRADLASLVAISQVHGRDKKAFVCLDIYVSPASFSSIDSILISLVQLVVHVGESSLEAMIVWRENVRQTFRSLNLLSSRDSLFATHHRESFDEESLLL